MSAGGHCYFGQLAAPRACVLDLLSEQMHDMSRGRWGCLLLYLCQPLVHAQGKSLTFCHVMCRSAFTSAQKEQMRMLSQRRQQMAMLHQQRMMQQIMWQMSRRGGGFIGPFGM